MFPGESICRNRLYLAIDQHHHSMGRRLEAQHDDLVALRALVRIRAGNLERQMPGVLRALRD